MPRSPEELELMRRWVDTWRLAGEELERIRREEIQSLDTHEAIHQIFDAELVCLEEAPTTSGLVDQQAWFARLRRQP